MFVSALARGVCRRIARQRSATLCSAALGLALLAGGAGLPILSAATTAPFTVTLSPGASTIASSGTVAYTAAVTGTTSVTITWFVDGIANGNATVGTLAGSGAKATYTAPAAAGTHTVSATATTAAGVANSGTAAVTVQAPVPTFTVVLSPGATTLASAGTQAYAAAVSGTTSVNLTWFVDGIANGNATVGTLAASGAKATYTAPAAAGTHTVSATATTASGVSNSGSSVVTVQAPPPPPAPFTVVLSPGSSTLTASGTLAVSAAVSGTTSVNITWFVDGIANGNATVGTLAGSGAKVTYTAPAAAGSHTIKATATTAAGVANSGTATVAVSAAVLPPVEVSMTLPAAASTTINFSGSMLFTAAVAGSGNTGLTWTVDGVANGNATVGTITASAAPTSTGITVIYTAPAVAGSHTVKAVSVANPADSASAVVTVASATVQVANTALVVNVKDAPYKAAGNGVADDTAAIQQAIDTVAGTGGQVLIPAGTYLINPVANDNAGLRVGSNMTLTMAAGAVLQALPTSTSNYVVVLVSGVANVNISGGTVIGNRNDNTITDTSEDGFGVQVANAQHVVVEGVTVTNCWADGFYIDANATDVTLCDDVANNSRRNGLSIVDAAGVVVRGCTFENATGSIENGVMTNGSGIDVEPNLGQTVSSVLISRNTFSSNYCLGISSGVPEASTGSAFVNTIFIDGNTFTSNRTRGISISNCSGTVVTNNTCTGNGQYSILFASGADNAVCTGNKVSGTTGAPGNGIDVDTCADDIVTGNTSTGNAGYGVYVVASPGCTVSGNTESGDGVAP